MKKHNEKVTARVKKSVRRGIFGHIFTSYDSLEAAWERSMIWAFFSGLFMSSPAVAARQYSARSAEHSAIIRAVNRFASIFPDITLRAYGVFIGAAGLYSSLIYVIKEIASSLTADIDTLITGVMLIIMSLPLLLSGKTLAEAVLTSRLGSELAFEVFGFRREIAMLPRKPRGRCDTPMLFGMIVGLSSFYIDIREIFAVLLAAAVIYLVLRQPEAGVVIVLALFPLMPAWVLKTFVAVIIVSYVTKLICGRRTLKFDIADAVMLLFVITVALAAAVNYGRGTDVGGGGIYVLYGCMYFVAVNLIKDEKWKQRCGRALIFGAVLTAAASFAVYFINYKDVVTSYVSSEALAGLLSYVRNLLYEVYGILPVMVTILPFMLGRVLAHRSGHGAVVMTVITALTAVSIVYTWTRGLWLAAIVGIILLLLIKDTRFIWLIIAGLLIIPALMIAFPADMRMELLGLFDMTGAGTVSRIEIRQTSLDIFMKNMIGGIGIGDGIFPAVYSQFAPLGAPAGDSQSLILQISVDTGLSGFIIFTASMLLLLCKSSTAVKNARSITEKYDAGACAAGLAAALVSGLTSNIWSDPKMFLFFMMFASFASAYNTMPADVLAPDPYEASASGSASIDIRFNS